MKHDFLQKVFGHNSYCSYKNKFWSCFEAIYNMMHHLVGRDLKRILSILIFNKIAKMITYENHNKRYHVNRFTMISIHTNLNVT